MVKVRNFFTQDKVFKQSRAARASFQGVVVIRNRQPLIGCQQRDIQIRERIELLLL